MLDSVGMTIQDKLKETSSSFQLKLAQDASEAQNHRAETDFDISGLKERMEAIDQGLNEVITLHMCLLSSPMSLRLTKRFTSSSRTSGTT